MAQRTVEIPRVTDLTETEKKILDLAASQPLTLLTPEDFSQGIGRKVGSDTLRTHLKNIRRNLLGEAGSIVSVRDIGAFYSSKPLETLMEKGVTLRRLGVSLHSEPDQEKAIVVPGLSVLTPDTGSEAVIELMDRVDIVKTPSGTPYLRPHIPPTQRELLAELDGGSVLSSEELIKAASLASPERTEKETANLLSSHLKNLRRKIYPQGLELCHQGEGWCLVQSGAEIERKGSISAKLLDYLLEKRGLCVGIEEGFGVVFDYPFDSVPKYNLDNFQAQLKLARRRLEKLGAEDCIATIAKANKVILCPHKPGTQVVLPGLYDPNQVPESIRYLIPQLEMGTLKRNSTILPVLTRTESELLFALAEEPGDPFHEYDLERHLWGPDFYHNAPHSIYTLTQHIHNLREKLQDIAPSCRIETQRSLGYALILAE